MKAKLFLFVVGLPLFASAQSEKVSVVNQSKQVGNPWTVSAILRKGLETKDDKEKPALLSLTWPQNDKSNTYLINGGLGLNFNHITKGKSILDITPSLVFNRNNQIKKEQHNLKALVSASYQIGKEDIVAKTHSRALVLGTAQHMWNMVDTSRSLFGTIYGTWVLKNKKGILINNYKNFGKSGFLLYFGPVVGFEYQDRYNVKKPETQGNIWRFYWSGDLRFALKRGNPEDQTLGFKRFELTFNYAQRHELRSTIPVGEGIIHLFKTEFSFFPVNSDKISLGLSYNEGEDPIAAIEKQNFWQLAFKLQLDYPFKK
jgi:hypothetical protein